MQSGPSHGGVLLDLCEKSFLGLEWGRSQGGGFAVRTFTPVFKTLGGRSQGLASNDEFFFGPEQKKNPFIEQ